MTVYAYIRVSSDKQNCANQKYEITTFCKSKELKINVWIQEIISTRKNLRERKLFQTLKKLKKGDILISTEISRLGRNMMEVIGILQQCLEKECQVMTIKEKYILGADIHSKVLAFAFSLTGEIERQLISQRTKEALKRLKDEGKHLGRPYGFSYRKLQKEHHKIKKLMEQKIPKTQIAKLMGCTWTTLNRYIHENILPHDI